MAEQVAPTTPPTESPPLTVSAEVYLSDYAHRRYEWVKGRLVKMAAGRRSHNAMQHYLMSLFQAYLMFRPVGDLETYPFIMWLETVESYRVPDLQIILNDNPGELTETGMHGAADILIEIVSEESSARDHGEKYDEYEQAGVREYWIIDPLRNECRFNRLTEQGHYETFLLKEAGSYTTPLLPDLVIDVAILWHDELPDIFAVGESVRAMLGDT